MIAISVLLRQIDRHPLFLLQENSNHGILGYLLTKGRPMAIFDNRTLRGQCWPNWLDCFRASLRPY
jgi:hypothetical protein